MKILQLFVAVAVTILATGCNNAKNMKTEVPEISAFPTGKSNVAYEQYFSGRSWLAPLTSMKELNVPVSNVTFEPGCRNNWHSHTGGNFSSVSEARDTIRKRENRPVGSKQAMSSRLLRTWYIGMEQPPTVGSLIWLSNVTLRPTAMHGSIR